MDDAADSEGLFLGPNVFVVDTSARGNLERAEAWTELFPLEAYNRLRLAFALLKDGDTEKIDPKYYNRVARKTALSAAKCLVETLRYEPLIHFPDIFKLVELLNHFGLRPSDIGFNRRSWRKFRREVFIEGAKYLYWYCLFEVPEVIGGEGIVLDAMLKTAKREPEDIGATRLEINRLMRGKAAGIAGFLAALCYKYEGAGREAADFATRNIAGTDLALTLPNAPYLYVVPRIGQEARVKSGCLRYFKPVSHADAIAALREAQDKYPDLWNIVVRNALTAGRNPVLRRMKTVKYPKPWQLVAYDQHKDTLTILPGTECGSEDAAIDLAREKMAKDGWDPELVILIRDPAGRIAVPNNPSEENE